MPSLTVQFSSSKCFGNVPLCTNGFTTAMWLNIKSAMFRDEDLYVISSGGQSPTDQGGIAILVKEKSLMVFVRDGKREWIGTVRAPKEKWFHLGISWSSKDNLIVYINGKAKAKATPKSYNGYPAQNMEKLQLGKPNNGMVKYGTFSIDEWYFWESSFDAEQMMDIYKKKCKQGRYL